MAKQNSSRPSGTARSRFVKQEDFLKVLLRAGRGIEMPTKKEQFAEFHDTHPGVMDIFLRFTDELRAAGVYRVRADEVLHRVRWEILTTGGGYCEQKAIYISGRLKVLYGNRYAIELMVKDKKYRGFFDLTVAHAH